VGHDPADVGRLQNGKTAKRQNGIAEFVGFDATELDQNLALRSGVWVIYECPVSQLRTYPCFMHQQSRSKRAISGVNVESIIVESTD
jgi:hypothetical protein